LEESGLELKDSLAIFNKAIDRLNGLSGPRGTIFKEKINMVVKKNPGLDILQQVNKLLQGEEVALPDGISPNEAAKLRFCPIEALTQSAASHCTSTSSPTAGGTSQRRILAWQLLQTLSMLARSKIIKEEPKYVL